MVKRRVIKFFVAFFLFTISLLAIQLIFFGQIYLFKGHQLEIKNFQGTELPAAENSFITTFAISNNSGIDASMISVVILGVVFFIAAIKFIYSHDKRTRDEFISSRTDRGLIKLDLP
jgi:hypothetical protein